MQKRLVTARKADEGFIDRAVAVGVQAHGLPHDIGAFGARARKQAHLVHGVKQFAVGGLKAVYLRDRAGDDDAHGVGHKVFLERFGDRLFEDDARVFNDGGVIFRLDISFFRWQVIFTSDKVLGFYGREKLAI